MSLEILKKYSLLFKLIITTGIFFLVFKNVDFFKSFQLLKEIDLFLFVIALMILMLQVIFATNRWKKVLENLSIQISYIKVLNYLWIGLFFNQALPSSVGGDSLRAYYLFQDNKCSIKDAAFGVLIDRIIGMFGLVLLVLSTFNFYSHLLQNQLAKWGLLIVSFSALGVIIAVLFFDYMPKYLQKWKVIRGLFSLAKKGRVIIFSFSPGLGLISISIFIHCLSITAVISLSQALNLDINLLGILMVVPAANIIMAAPISIAGWGVREGIMVLGLGYIGVASEQALALSLTYGILTLIVSLPGSIFWLQNNYKHNQA
jgi:glycosyltransferase 2 family protein